ncbi:hypothetical protein DCAR_0101229 [Daucus carota subsp. sativus]|uniref:Knottin scorpion toxin-like domain-containing protein n=1 Tax=Daucus carota subsp. sativus TaxID=79200 RepID=A0AAF0W2V1_DAUCS|nr:hypothetical protein DCAR_0101229 [Daucus carota subsp. sativus]
MAFTKYIIVFMIPLPFIAAIPIPEPPTPSSPLDAVPGNCNRSCGLLYTSGDCNRDCIIKQRQRGGACQMYDKILYCCCN